jgi:hypothetical protein
VLCATWPAVSATVENEAVPTVENKATHTDGWVISVEDWALIRRLVADGVPRRQVARQLGIGRATGDRAVASDRPPKYERRSVPTAFTPFEARVRAILTEYPEVPATVIAERVGWQGSIPWSAIMCAGCGPSIVGLIRRTGCSGSRRRGAVRSVVPAEADPAGGRDNGVAAGAGHRRSALAVHHRADAADASGPRICCWGRGS